MASILPPPLLRLRYFRAARDYCAQLPPEHFMEATPQGTQREVSLESMALVKAQRSDVHVFNELLVQYPVGRHGAIHQVVPDNMIVLYDGVIEAEGSYDMPFQPIGPFMTMEYVSKSSERKDYEDSFHKYERELKVPYYLTFYPDNQELTLHRHNGRKYVTVKPNAHGRCAVPELDLEVKIEGGWVRFWYQGALLPLPADLLRELKQVKRLLEQQTRRADDETRRADGEKRRADDEKRARLAMERQLADMQSQMEQLRKKQKNGRKNGGA
jgi:Uma2 family endonuclease